MAWSFAYFDLAGTLLEKPGSYEVIADVLDRDVQAVRVRHRLLLETTTFPGRTTREFYDRFNGELARSLGVTPSGAQLGDIYRRIRSLEWAAFPDVSALAQLPLPLGIISNWDTAIEPLVRELLDGLTFQHVIGSTGAGFAKPDRRIYELALTRATFPASEVLYVGDSIHLDVAPAMAVGMHTLLVDRDVVFPTFPGRIGSLEEVVGHFA